MLTTGGMVFLSLWVLLCVVSILDRWSFLLIVISGRIVALVVIIGVGVGVRVIGFSDSS